MTDNGKLAIMELDQDYEPGLPLSPGILGQDDQQQLLWGFPDILWPELVVSGQTYCLSAVGTKQFPLSAVGTKQFPLEATNENCNVS